MDTGLFGPVALSVDDIDKNVRGVSPGTYLLGRPGDNVFLASYVGRSDTDLNGRLKNWVGSKYSHALYGFFQTAKAAFNKECALFHAFGGAAKLDNEVHPARPKGTDWTCAHCNALD